MRPLIRFFLILTITVLISCDRDEDPVPSPASVIGVTPLQQIGYTGTVSLLPAAVQVLDKDGIPVSGIEVTFTLSAGNAELHNERMETDANGTAFSYLTFT